MLPGAFRIVATFAQPFFRFDRTESLVGVFDGEYVEQGEMIADGEPNPHDILRLLGVQELAAVLRRSADAVSMLLYRIRDKLGQCVERALAEESRHA